MKEIILPRDSRLALRAQAHHLDPVVLLGANGLTDAVMKEIDRELTAHELIKVRVPTDDREEREAIFEKVALELGAARVQMIGKLLVFWRPSEEVAEKHKKEEARAKAIAQGKMTFAGGKKVASKKPGEKKARPAAKFVYDRRKARSKLNRSKKKSALG